jgi:CheY-like chemotaxis protein
MDTGDHQRARSAGDQSYPPDAQVATPRAMEREARRLAVLLADWLQACTAPSSKPLDLEVDRQVTVTQKTVLVADDEPSLRLLVSATIASDQYGVIEATDGDEAWRLLVEHRPEVALLDIQMPGRTGLELTRAIRADAALSGTYVILLTSKAQEADVQAGLAAGADRYLTKPFSPLELLTAVEEALGLAP